MKLGEFNKKVLSIIENTFFGIILIILSIFPILNIIVGFLLLKDNSLNETSIKESIIAYFFMFFGIVEIVYILLIKLWKI